MYKRRRIYEAPEKIIYEGASQGTYVQFFKDDSAAEQARTDGKAALHNRISEYIFTRLNEAGLPNYFIKSLNMREQLVHSVEMIPLKLMCRNAVSPALARRLGLAAGAALPRPLFEFYYANAELGDPLVSDEHILTLGWAGDQDLEEMLAFTARINDFLCGLFAGAGLRLAEFTVEFGRLWSNGGDMMQLLLASELSPDSCLLWPREFALKAEQAAQENRPKTSPEIAPADSHKPAGLSAGRSALRHPADNDAAPPAAHSSSRITGGRNEWQDSQFAGISHKDLALRLELLKGGSH